MNFQSSTNSNDNSMKYDISGILGGKWSGETSSRINNEFSTKSDRSNILSGLMLNETQARNYNTRPKLHKLHSFDQVVNKYIECIKNNNIVLLHELLNDFPNACDLDGLSPMKIAILCNNITAAKTILNYNVVDNGIMAFACEHNYDNLLDELIFELLKDSKFDVNMKGGASNEIPLYYAINNDRELSIVKGLLDNVNTNINLTFDNWKSMLHYCIFNKKYDVCMLLLKYDTLVLLNEDLKTIFNECPISIINTLVNSKLLEKCEINLNEHFVSLLNRFDTNSSVLLSLVKYIDINYCDIYGKTPLMYCIDSEDINKLTFVLKVPNIDLSITDNYGMNALMYAILKRNFVYTKMLVDFIKTCDNCDAIVNQFTKIRETPLLMVVKKNDVASFKLICDIECLNVNCTDVFGYTPLHYSIKTDAYDIFELLISNKNIDVNVQDLEGMCPLMHSIDNKNEKMIYKLLSQGNLNINIQNNNGQNVLNYILKKKYEKTSDKSDSIIGNSELFGDGGLGLAQYPACFSYTQMNTDNNTSSFEFDKSKLINTVIQKGADLNIFDINDESLLMNVIDNDDKEIFNLLINSENLDINAQNSTGQTYLMYLFGKINNVEQPVLRGEGMIKSDMYNSLESSMMKQSRYPPKSSSNSNVYLTFFMQLLNHPKIDINLPNYLNNTLLSLVSATPNTNILTKIINHKGIDVNMKNYKGMTAFHAATLNHLWNNVKILLSFGADAEITDNKGNIAYNYLDEANSFIYRKIVGLRNKTIIDQINKQITEQPELTSNKKGWIF